MSMRRIGRLLTNIAIIIAIAYITLLYVNRNGSYPWGSDVNGHLFKAEILFDSLQRGDFYLNYDFNWYNGLQPYRYWGPMPYYILALINFLTHDIFKTYNLFIMLVFITGGTGFALWGYYLNRQNLGLIFGLLWFFVPNNLEVVFSQGNVPYIVVINVLPYLFLFYFKSLNEDKLGNYMVISLLMSFITLNHAMLTALIGISLFLYTLFYTLWNKNYAKGLLGLIFAFLGIGLSAYWLVPALKGGILGQSKEVVTETMKVVIFPLRKSLNPLYRLQDREMYYFGLAFASIACFGMFFSNEKEKSGFIVPLIILAGTTTAAFNIISKFPMSQLFWMARFTSIGLCMILFSIMIWKSLRQSILVILVTCMVLDCVISFRVEADHIPIKQQQVEFIEVANTHAAQRVAMIDASSDGSFPSYYISYDKRGKGMPQVYGWAWQGATTSKNIVQINEMWENNYFVTMFDRCLELGADVAIVKRCVVKDELDLIESAHKVGYQEIFRDTDHMIFKYDIDTEFGSIVEYDGLAIGKYASNLCNLYPSYRVGESNVLDDYEIGDFDKYDRIYLAGFEMKDKAYGEQLIEELGARGKKVVIDMNGIDEEGFRSIYGSQVRFHKDYGEFYYQGQLKDMTDFPEGLLDFRAVTISGDINANQDNVGVLNGRVMNYMYEETEHISFIGMNLVYYAVITKDPTALAILEDVFDQELYELPKRRVVPLEIEVYGDEKIEIRAPEKGVLAPIAAIDAFVAEEGEFTSLNHLVLLEDNHLTLSIGYPYLKVGVAISTFSMILIILLAGILRSGKLDEILNSKEVKRHGTINHVD